MNMGDKKAGPGATLYLPSYIDCQDQGGIVQELKKQAIVYIQQDTAMRDAIRHNLSQELQTNPDMDPCIANQTAQI